ncbi:MAG: peptidoglycan D,D-transpeptidase FtsI family protein [Candidatus Melainabacteria bacterium]|jgi:cell division protein FtsI/penicillin-binding protein 2
MANKKKSAQQSSTQRSSAGSSSRRPNGSVQSNSQRNRRIVVLWRVRFVQFCLTLFLIAIFGKTLFLQSMKASDLKRASESQKRRSSPTTIFRGEITDRNGVLLAVDTARFDLFMRPPEFKADSEQLKELGKILQISEVKLEEYLQSNKKIIRLASSLSRSKADSIAKLKMLGLNLDPINSREYPQGKLAAHLLGFVSWDSSGKAGIEESLNTMLRQGHSEMSKKTLMRADGRPITHSVPLKPIINSSFGRQIELTINSKLQYKVEQILDENVNKFKANKGTAIVINPSNGEILAWANSPSYNPNFYGQYSPARTVNWAISQIYEPGSTFKILTVASALQLKSIKTDFKFMDEGKIKIGNRTIYNHDYKPDKVREIGLLELFRYSSNTAAAMIGMRMNKDKFYEQLCKFGIAEKTKVEVPGESAGFLADPQNWKEIDTATTSFGQGAVAVTPIQLAAAVNAIANKGEWVQPHLVKSIKSADGKRIIEEIRPEKRRVVSAKVAKQVSDLLAQSIKVNLEEDPSYLAGNITGYEVAGKTGTAQKYCPNLKRYCPGETIASFIGYFPAANPRFLVLVVVDSPAAGGGWGNTVAGPIFNQIGESILKIYPENLIAERKFSLFQK